MSNQENPIPSDYHLYYQDSDHSYVIVIDRITSIETLRVPADMVTALMQRMQQEPTGIQGKERAYGTEREAI